jgi:hypothetical protein
LPELNRFYTNVEPIVSPRLVVKGPPEWERQTDPLSPAESVSATSSKPVELTLPNDTPTQVQRGYHSLSAIKALIKGSAPAVPFGSVTSVHMLNIFHNHHGADSRGTIDIDKQETGIAT